MSLHSINIFLLSNKFSIFANMCRSKGDILYGSYGRNIIFKTFFSFKSDYNCNPCGVSKNK